MDEKDLKIDTSLEPKPKEAVKKIAESVKQLAPKKGASTNYTTKELFLKRLNAEKDPEKKKLIMQALQGRMFQ